MEVLKPPRPGGRTLSGFTQRRHGRIAAAATIQSRDLKAPDIAMIRKGIVLAGGLGTRLHPLTLVTSKQLLPVYDKPMVYYPLSVLMLAGIQEVLVISTPTETPKFEQLLGDGARIGMRIEYKVQPQPGGIAQAFLVGRDFVAGEGVSLVLGDNLFFGHGLQEMVVEASSHDAGATIFAYQVRDPERYGVVEIDATGKPTSLVEKPKNPKSNLAVTGLYFYDKDVTKIAENLKPSARGELEITDLNRTYLERGDLRLHQMGRGFAWLDTGTPSALLQAANFVETIESRQGLKIACIEEIAFRKGFISRSRLESLGQEMKSPYGEYLISIATGRL
jgi:glucose-1-phosphate thymidylyltransferase